MAKAEGQHENSDLQNAAPTRTMPLSTDEFDAALGQNTASFAQFCEAYFYSLDTFDPRPEVNRAYEPYVPKLKAAFQKTHGLIVELYLCTENVGAVVLTERNVLHFVLDVNAAKITKGALEVDELFRDCEWLSREAARVLRGSPELAETQKMLYDTAASLLALLDSQPMDPRDLKPHLARCRDMMSRSRRYYIRAAQRTAQMSYFRGMQVGLLITFILGAATGAVALFLPENNFVSQGLVISLLSGSVGAIVSVMARMTAGRLRLDYEAMEEQLRRLGAMRPLIGAVFGVAFYVLIRSELLPFEDPPKGADLYMYSALAFLSGFNERWAQDMLAMVQSTAGTSPSREIREGVESPAKEGGSN